MIRFTTQLLFSDTKFIKSMARPITRQVHRKLIGNTYRNLLEKQ